MPSTSELIDCTLYFHHTVWVLQLDVQTRSTDARAELCRFMRHIMALLAETSNVYINDLDSHLCVVRDGVVSDEKSMKRNIIPRCK